MSDTYDDFIFYPSWMDTIQTLEPEERLEILEAIIGYGCFKEIPDELSQAASLIFNMAVPNIDASQARRKGGSKGGRPSKKPMVKTNGKNHRLKPMVTSLPSLKEEGRREKGEEEKEVENTPQTPQGASVRTDFSLKFDFGNRFWPNINRKIGKGQALKAYISAYKKNDCQLTPEELAEKYNQHVDAQKEIQYSKHPATWLNAIGWEDEEATPRGYQSPPEELEQVTLAEPEGWLEHVRVSYSQHVYQRMIGQYEGNWENLKQSEQEAITENMAEEVA